MDTHTLTSVLLDQKEVFSAADRGVAREIDLERHRAHGQIVVVSGVRRSGKSTLLKQFATRYPAYHYVNFDDERLINFRVEDFADLMILFKKQSDADVLFMDEIQNVEHWERFARRIHDEGYKLYLSGSNAKLPSSELGTHLTGRYVKVELYPFSFREYLAFHGVNTTPLTSTVTARILKHFDRYLEGGGFPEVLKYRDSAFLSRTYEDIIHRDIISRHGIREVKQFLQLAHYLFTNVTGDLSYNAIKNVLGIKSPISVKKYVGYLEDSYLAFELYKHDFSLKRQHANTKKIYVIDNGMRNQVSFRFAGDLGKLLENMVYIELLRSRQEVYVHREQYECDFIIREKNRITRAIQVCYDLKEENRQREIRGLTEAAHQYGLSSGLLLNYDQSGRETVDNVEITILPVWRWLLENDRVT